MPPPVAKKYREQVIEVMALQYDGTNADAVIAFVGNSATIKDGKLYVQTSADHFHEMNATEWVYTDPWSHVLWMTDYNFQITYAPGPQQVESQPA